MSAASETCSAKGAYGLVPQSEAEVEKWWNPAGSGWLPWQVSWQQAEIPPATTEHISGTRARLRLLPGGYADIDRESRSTVLLMPESPVPAGLVHPHLGSTAVINAMWQGWESFHAGAFVAAGRVWAVLGDREQGKSSTLAWLHGRGHRIFTDDLVVLRGTTALAGPRCLDLREEAVERFGIGEHIGVVGSRPRWRVHLPPVPAELPLGGWIVLRWGGTGFHIRTASAAERLAALAEARALMVARDPTTTWLDLLAVPMLVFERARRWEVMDQAMHALVEAVTVASQARDRS